MRFTMKDAAPSQIEKLAEFTYRFLAVTGRRQQAEISNFASPSILLAIFSLAALIPATLPGYSTRPDHAGSSGSGGVTQHLIRHSHRTCSPKLRRL